MNVILPDKQKIKNRQVIIYTTIIAICAISIIVAFYVQLNSMFDIKKLLGIKRRRRKLC